ncbi:hypothetical protein ACFWDI_26900 [Streptomyces sp. NPDC060064]|uniref:hypothetical protein n=1 Tax=Streptomyces sp. NPDC060064 TaxID=3347049 RepID=UPI00367ADD7B
MNRAADIVTSYSQAGGCTLRQAFSSPSEVSAGPVVRRYFKWSPDAIAELTSLLPPGDSRR